MYFCYLFNRIDNKIDGFVTAGGINWGEWRLLIVKVCDSWGINWGEWRLLIVKICDRWEDKLGRVEIVDR